MIKSFQGKNRWLSNFWPAKVMLDGVMYPSTENAYQAAKTSDLQSRTLFETCEAKVAKKLGKQVEMREDWEAIKVNVMFDLLMQKFQDPELRDKLRATGKEELVEGNTWGDVFWGRCNGVGENVLGKLLMKVRDTL